MVHGSHAVVFGLFGSGLVLGVRKVANFDELEADGGVGSLKLKPHTVARNNAARNPKYPPRAEVDDAHVFWSAPWRDYKPVDFTDDIVTKAVWADPMTVITDPNAEQWEDELHRTYTSCPGGMTAELVGRSSSECFSTTLVPERSHTTWNIPHNGNTPLNPMGRTGMTGRGLLGKFGANHAADPLVTRFHDGVLEIALIRRSDGGRMAIPGGMVEAGDTVSATLSKEFQEEALRGNKPEGMSDAAWEARCTEIAARIEPLFNRGVAIYTGYVDDPRNTDNAWMETAAYHFHGEEGEFDEVQLTAGDDAVGVGWVAVREAIAPSYPMYASHKDLVQEMYRLHCQSHSSQCH